MREINPLYRPDITYNYTNSMTYEIDHCAMATQQAEFFAELDQLNAEDYAYFLAHGEVPPSTNNRHETEAA